VGKWAHVKVCLYTHELLCCNGDCIHKETHVNVNSVVRQSVVREYCIICPNLTVSSVIYNLASDYSHVVHVTPETLERRFKDSTKTL
jgi:hypothetical protein